MASKPTKMTVCGITIHANLDAVNDYRVITSLTSDDDNRRVQAFDKLLRLVLGKEYDSTLDQLQGDEAYLSADKVREFADDLMEKANALKN